jgi:DNA-binding response OmpR family regulator
MRQLDSPLVLVLEPDRALADAIGVALRGAGLQVVACRHAADAVAAVSFHRPSVVLVDVGADDGHGWDVLAAARDHGHLPVIVLDRDDDAATHRAAYAAGADDVLPTTVDPTDLAARVGALARRARPDSRAGTIHRHRDLVMDVSAHVVTIGGSPVGLTAQQFAILRALLEAGGATLGREQLVSRTGALDDEPPSDRAIDLHVTRLRRRLGDDPQAPRYIEAVYGVGYRLARGGGGVQQHVGADASTLLDALPDAVLVLDRDLVIHFANLSTELLLGVPRASLAGQHCGAVLACTSCGGLSLDGPRCIGRAALGGLAQVHDAPALVRGPAGPLPVSLSYGQLDLGKGDALLTVTIRPRPGSAAV